MAVDNIEVQREQYLNKNASSSIFEMLGKYYGIIFAFALFFISLAHLKKVVFIDEIYLECFTLQNAKIPNLFGECGVKMFYFMAGFGAYFSLTKNSAVWDFLVRRAKRMFPYYYTLLVILLFYYRPEINEIIANIVLVGWWMNMPNQFFWFHHAIFVIYIFAPLFFCILNKSKNLLYHMGFLWTVFLLIGLLTSADVRHQGVHVIPLFLTGMLFCKFYIEKKTHNKYLIPATYIGAIASVIYLLSKYEMIGPFQDEMPATFPHLLITLISVALSFFVVQSFNFFDKLNLKTDRVQNLLRLLGKRSLEIYLMQVILLDFCDYRSRAMLDFDPIFRFFDYSYNYPIAFCIVFMAIALSFPCGILYGKLVDRFILRKKD